jgi:hypothetical protein
MPAFEEANGHEGAQRAALDPGPSSATRVREMLAYLAAALPACTSAAARLTAVQCALRADSGGRLWLSNGVMRSMRLAHLPVIWRELEQAAWLRPGHSTAGFRCSDLLDSSVFMQAPGRRARAQAADWAYVRPVVRQFDGRGPSLDWWRCRLPRTPTITARAALKPCT